MNGAALGYKQGCQLTKFKCNLTKIFDQKGYLKIYYKINFKPLSLTKQAVNEVFKINNKIN